MGEWDTGYSAITTPAGGDDFLIRQVSATPPSGGTVRRISFANLAAAIGVSEPAFAESGTYYVTQGGSDSNDGLTWQTAFATVNHAISAIGTGGGVIEVGYGTFAPFTVSSNRPALTIRGRGMGQTYDLSNNITSPVYPTQIRNASTGATVTVQGPGTFGPSGGPVPNVLVIEDLAITGNAGGGDGLYAQQTENIVVRNVNIDSCAGFGWHPNNVYGVEFDNVQITRCGLAAQTGRTNGGGIYLDPTLGQVNGHLYANSMTAFCYGTGCYSGGAQDIVFSLCNFESNRANATPGTGKGVYTDATGSGAGPYTFDGCWFEDNTGEQLFNNGFAVTWYVAGCQFFGDSSSTYGIGNSGAGALFMALYACNFNGHTSGYSIDNSQGGIQLNWGSCDSSDTTGFVLGFANGTPISAVWSPRAGLGLGTMYTGTYMAVYPQARGSDGAVTLDASIGQVNVCYLSANATSSTLINGQPGATCTVTWVQDASGGRTYVWPANCKFAGGAAPAGTAANSQNSVTFWFDGTSWWETSRAIGVH